MGPREVPWQSRRDAFASCCGGFCGSKAAAGVLRILRGAQTCHVAVSKPNRNSLWGLGRYHGKAGGTPSQAAVEGFAVQRPSKAAAGLLRLLRGAQNVPRSSFKAQ